MNKNPYDVLELPKNATIDEVKRKYKEIALQCHPDKLFNITDEKEKKERVEKFKNANIAYNIIVNGKYNDNINYDDLLSPTDWKETWENIFKYTDITDVLKDTINEISTIFSNNNIKPHSYYIPSTNYINHDINLPVSYNDVYNNNKRKLRLILNGIEEPVFIDIFCNKFPKIIKYYLDDDNNEHEITINMTLTKDDNYSHIINENNSIDLITTVEITLLEYLIGVKKDIDYINNKLNIDIPPFVKEYIIINGKGLRNNGNLIINIIVKNMEKYEWNKISESDKSIVIRILNATIK